MPIQMLTAEISIHHYILRHNNRLFLLKAMLELISKSGHLWYDPHMNPYIVIAQRDWISIRLEFLVKSADLAP